MYERTSDDAVSSILLFLDCCFLAFYLELLVVFYVIDVDLPNYDDCIVDFRWWFVKVNIDIVVTIATFE